MKSVRTPSTVVVPAGRICPRCGAPLGGFGPEGMCGACLFDAGLAADEPAAELDFITSGPRRFGDYELLEEIARGGMGVVFRARQLSLNRIVAVKMILRGEFASVGQLARFRAEAEIAARLQHPNIVAIHEVGEHEGQPYFSMDYVAGQNLAQLVGNTPLPAASAAKYLKTVAETVQYAHEQGVLHRDLKPSNVLIDANDQPCVTDFGLAKQLTGDASLTLTDQVLGSPNFMPPEQAAGKNDAIGPASDVYSMGAMLYHALTGRPPFVAESVTATLRLVAEIEPVSPRLLVPTVPRDLETICLKCLQKEPQRRYPKAQALADDLAHFLRDEPIRARPVSQGERLWRWCRRNRALAGAGAAVILLLLTVAAGSTIAAARLKAVNREGQEKLRESLLSQARAGRWSGRVGQRFDGLEALKMAVEIRPSIELRNEAIACLALVDMRPVKALDFQLGGVNLSFDPAYSRYTMGDTEGNVIVRRMRDGAELVRFPGLPASPYGPLFSPRGRYLAISRMDGANRPLEICDLDRHEIVLAVPSAAIRDLDFSPDERFLYVVHMDRPLSTIFRFSVPSGESRELLQLAEVPSAARLNPAGDQLAISSTESRKVHVLSAETGKVLYSLEHSNVVHALCWHPEGRLLATACGDRRIYLWDTIDRQLLRVIEGHDSAVISVYFSHRGELLASSSWDNTVRLWNVWTGRQILSRPCFGWVNAFSADDRSIAVPEANSFKICEVAGGREWRGLYLTKSSGPEGGGCAWSPDGRVLASAHHDGLRLWDSDSGREINFLPSEVGEQSFICFDSSGSNLVATTSGGLRGWPVSWHREEAGDKLLLGPAQSIGAEAHSGSGLCFNQTGDRLAAGIGGAIEVFEWPSRRPLQTLRHKAGVYGFVMSPSGQFCVGWPRAGDLPRQVWDATTGVVLFDLPVSVSGVYGAAFSPNDQLLITGNRTEYQAWDTRSWTNIWKLSRPHSQQPGRIAFNRGGTMGALTFAGHSIRLFEPATGNEFATLEAPDSQNIMWLAFSPDASHLAATTASSVVHMWDLRLIRQELAAMKLDWDGPPFPPAATFDKKQISVEVLVDSASGSPTPSEP